MIYLSQQEHAVQQIDENGAMIGVSRQWYEEAKEQLAEYENTGLSPEAIRKLIDAPKLQKFERQPLNEGGWTVSTEIIKDIAKEIEDGQPSDDIPSWEQIEDVLLAIERLYID